MRTAAPEGATNAKLSFRDLAREARKRAGLTQFALASPERSDQRSHGLSPMPVGLDKDAFAYAAPDP